MHGSSPREWGMQSSSNEQSIVTRFIPTRVGNAPIPARRCSREAVHPHASGECVRFRDIVWPPTGSSPREWGMLVDRIAKPRLKRFIPTRVGNADPKGSPHLSAPVHPHASGECETKLAAGAVGGGSSPREWGMPTPDSLIFASKRFIPTRVGNACPCIIK